MAGILDGVDKRTQLVGENRLELLMFRLQGPQLYGINVFKVQEVIQCPALTHIPNSNPVVKGVAKLRGRTIPVIDLSMSLGMPPMENMNGAFVIIADYNRSVQGFLVHGMERIVNMNWDEISAPPKGLDSYMTAVTRVDGKLVEIIDVEKVLADIAGTVDDVSENLVGDSGGGNELRVLVADDSSVARKQIQRAMKQIGVEAILAKDGQEALDLLRSWVKDDPDISKHISLLISDVEMPNMDGYTLTTEIRKDPQLNSLYVILHTSLSGIFNQAMVEKVGANKFIAKFNADELAEAVLEPLGRQVKEKVAVG